MTLRLVSSPWAAFCGEAPIEIASDSSVPRTSGLIPRLIGDDTDILWNGSRLALASWAGADGESQWDLPLPTAHGEQAVQTLRIGRNSFSVAVGGLPKRASESSRENDRRENWLNWQLQRYAELASLDHGAASTRGLEARLPFGARRSWPSVSCLWQMGESESAELSLIVRLAKRTPLLAALRAIEGSPRKLLQRRHIPQRISRIQEMDATTLSAYSRAPGRNAAEKAGARQELLAVVRTESIDLVENRVLLWCAYHLDRLASAYCQRNRTWSGSQRYTLVQNLRRLSRRLVASPQLEGVGPLPHHLSTPTYCLQFDRRYRQIWRVYRELRQRQRQIDDAWRWHSRLWGTTSRLLLASLLTELDGWYEPGQSTPYFRTEGLCGDWTAGPSTPGPFQSPYGRCEVLEFRSPQVERAVQELGLPASILQAGADWALTWPLERRLLLVWSAVGNSSGSVTLDAAPLARSLCASRVQSGWSWSGLILLAEPGIGASKSSWIDSHPPVGILRCPEDLHRYWEDLRTSLELILGEVHRG